MSEGIARHQQGGISMKKILVVTAATLSLTMLVSSAFCDVKKGGKIDAKAEFQEHCASCHPNGGNIVNAKKTLSKKDLTANGIKTPKDIVAKMRNPGPGMTKFTPQAVSDAEAKAIAQYILKTFK
jgi:cytochrome c6